MLITDVSKKYAVSTRTLRYYEELGLITSARNDSNIRYYEHDQLLLIEEILIYKSLNIKLQDIATILKSQDKHLLRELLYHQLNKLDTSIIDLKYKRQLVRSTLQTFGSDDMTKVNLKAFISEQLFFRSSDERWTNMIENDSHITIDIGKDLIPIALDDAKCSLFSSIKELRAALSKDYDINLKKIRVKDNLNDLSPNEFQILNDDKVLIRKQINSENQQLQVDQIITQLKAIVL